MKYDIINYYASSNNGYQVKTKIKAVKQWSVCGDLTESVSVQLQAILKARRLEGITHQPPKPPFRPRLPHQNFLDFSKSLENSKNLPDYREYSKYCEYHINFSILWH
jgi:hypothetical protein